VLAGDFAAGLASSVARSAAKKKEAALKTQKGKERAGNSHGVEVLDSSDGLEGSGGGLDGLDDVAPPCPGLEPYEPDSQTIIVDCIRDVEDLIQLPSGLWMILQRCEKHAVKAIKARLIKKGYIKRSRDTALDLIWK
jgi:hypothetical protein